VSSCSQIENLKNFRLVCRVWNQQASPILQERSCVRLMQPAAHQELALFSRLMSQFEHTDPKDIFFRHYVLKMWNMENMDPSAKEECYEFWKKFGYSMKSLELVEARFYGSRVVQDVLFKWPVNCERLVYRDCSCYSNERKQFKHMGKDQLLIDSNIPKNYKMKSLEIYGGEGQCKPPVQWQTLFFAYPNLKVC